jgi:hypothetical protein
MIELDELEREIEQFHANVQHSNQLLKALTDTTDALREQTAASELVITHTNEAAIQIPQKTEERLGSLYSQFADQLINILHTAQGMVKTETDKAVEALNLYNQDTKAAHAEMKKVSGELAQIEQRWNDLISEQIAGALEGNADNLRMLTDETVSKVSTVINTYQRAEQERLLSLIQTQNEHSASVQQQIQILSEKTQASDTVLSRIMQDMDQQQQIMLQELQSVKKDVQELKRQNAYAAEQEIRIRHRNKIRFWILFTLLLVMLLGICGILFLK